MPEKKKHFHKERKKKKGIAMRYSKTGISLFKTIFRMFTHPIISLLRRELETFWFQKLSPQHVDPVFQTSSWRVLCNPTRVRPVSTRPLVVQWVRKLRWTTCHIVELPPTTSGEGMCLYIVRHNGYQQLKICNLKSGPYCTSNIKLLKNK